jgi:hypothetical protein
MDPLLQTAVKSRPDLGRKRTKPTPQTGTVQITFRLDVDAVRQIDAEAERIARENPGLSIGRTEIIRMLITESLVRRAKRGK